MPQPQLGELRLRRPEIRLHGRRLSEHIALQDLVMRCALAAALSSSSASRSGSAAAYHASATAGNGGCATFRCAGWRSCKLRVTRGCG